MQEQIILTLVPLLFPIVTGIMYVLVKNLVLRLPDQQRIMLEQFSHIAVKQIEQQHLNDLSIEKKELAVSAVESLFHDFHLPVPSSTLISIAIEAACYELKVFTAK